MSVEGEPRPVVRPAAAPCGSCPYRRDVPSGIWSEEEYAKLPGYDAETASQPVGVFLCHQQDGRVCAGWAAVHGDGENLALRIAAAVGAIDVETLDAVLDYTAPVPVFSSGAEAAEYGLAEIVAPSSRAVETIRRLDRKRKRR